MLQISILIDALSSACLEKKKKTETASGLFPRVGHALLVVPHGVFMATRCN
jgi:hypothetical protein